MTAKYDIDYGTKGFFDTLSGLHPCKIVDAADTGGIRVEFTQTSLPYYKGAQQVISFAFFVLKDEVKANKYSRYIVPRAKTINPEILAKLESRK